MKLNQSGRLVVSGIFFAAALAATAGETRYLANGGDDAADGMTPATAWRTLEKASESLPAGAALRMKCGDVFYGQLRPTAGLDVEHPTVVTSWGEGPKPVVSATKNLRGDPSAWEDMTHCFWRIDLANPTNSTGVVTDDCNPGFLLVDGEVKPWKRFCRSDLVSPWDFCGEGGYLYVHAEANPAKVAKDIRVALNVHCVQFGSFTVISNIAVRATGAHGMHAGWGRSVRNVRIADCELEDIGGSELMGYERQRGFRIRFGNGIELGGDAVARLRHGDGHRRRRRVRQCLRGCAVRTAGRKGLRRRNALRTDRIPRARQCLAWPRRSKFDLCKEVVLNTSRSASACILSALVLKSPTDG